MLVAKEQFQACQAYKLAVEAMVEDARARSRFLPLFDADVSQHEGPHGDAVAEVAGRRTPGREG